MPTTCRRWSDSFQEHSLPSHGAGNPQRNFRFHRVADPPQPCPSSRVLASPDGTRQADGEEEASSGSDGMDVDAAANTNANGPKGGGGGNRPRRNSFSSQVRSKETAIRSEFCLDCTKGVFTGTRKPSLLRDMGHNLSSSRCKIF